MKRMIGLILLLSLLLSGCGFWMNGSYSSVVPHTEPDSQGSTSAESVANYFQIKSSLIAMIINGAQSAVFAVGYESLQEAQQDMYKAINEVCETNPYAAYAVESIRYETGTGNGQNAFRVQISYLQNRVDVKTIRTVNDMEEAKQLIAEQLDACSAGVVFHCDSWGQKDYAQIVADYALQNPHMVIEQPEVTVNLYPEKGTKQIVELKFNYQTSRDSLRTMQSQVALVLASAEQYADRSAAEAEQFAQLYQFLMNRYSFYEIQTSITPAYSLLRHGVGDERAFAMVYAAMCRRIGLNCRVVTGTRNGEPWSWNVVKTGDVYYHVDLLHSREEGRFTMRTGEQMYNYVWDYSLYPFARQKIS